MAKNPTPPKLQNLQDALSDIPDPPHPAAPPPLELSPPSASAPPAEEPPDLLELEAELEAKLATIEAEAKLTVLTDELAAVEREQPSMSLQERLLYLRRKYARQLGRPE